MASSSSSVIPIVENEEIERKELELQGHNLRFNNQNQSQQQQVLSHHNLRLVDKTLFSAANLAQLLPTGTVLAFQALSPSFANQGKCYVSNKCLTALLLFFCLLSCVFFSFTDSLTGQNGKLYYGLATFKGFYVFKFNGSESEDQAELDQVLTDGKKLRIRTVDFVHAFFSAIVFLSVSLADTGVQNCFSQDASRDVKEVLVNFPLGAALVSSFMFLVFPTTRKGIGYTNVTHYSS
ncbi:hypothetical protein LUZ60_016172 [Juncus effusus]|nr:hypothetical protein LUZ60_016172 [Juncus effusus]